MDFHFDWRNEFCSESVCLKHYRGPCNASEAGPEGQAQLGLLACVGWSSEGTGEPTTIDVAAGNPTGEEGGRNPNCSRTHPE